MSKSDELSRDWHQEELAYLRLYPRCVDCLGVGKVVPAKFVSHIEPHGGDVELFWDEGNWVSVCRACNEKRAEQVAMID